MPTKKNYPQAKGRGNGSFFSLPHAVINCPNYFQLSYKSRAMLVELGTQFNGSNNGDLSATRSFLSDRGWKSSDTIFSAIEELIYYGFIARTQEGGLNVAGKQRPHLYALTWLRIDKIGYSDGFRVKSKYTVGDVLRTWSDVKPPMKTRKKKQINPQQRKKMNTRNWCGTTPENGAEGVKMTEK